jgi:glycosyltransferase involved in cell wall biosynthesis
MKNDLSKVSIVMSSYNHEKFVEKAVVSAITQTYQNIELIVIDDGSTDGSVAILKALQEKYNFYLECRENHGLVKTLNYALKNLVTGKYVCILDSDDYFREDKIEKQVKVLEANPQCGLCYNPLYYIDTNNNIISDKIDPKNRRTGYIFEEFFRGDAHIPDGGVLIPLKVFQEINYYDEDVALEDYQLWFKILSKYPVCYINEHLTYYRTHETNVSNDEYKMLQWEIQVIDKWKEHPVYEKSKPYLFTRWFAKYAKYDKIQALNYFFKSIPYVKTYVNKEFYKGIRRTLFYWRKLK